MTHRFNALTVCLEQDIQPDDAQVIINAIQQIKGVLKVSGNVADLSSWNAEQRVRHELGRKMYEILYPPNPD